MLSYDVNSNVRTLISIKTLETASAATLGYLKIEGIGTDVAQVRLAGISFDGQIIRNENKLDLKVFDALGRLIISSIEDVNMKSNPKGLYIIKSNYGTMKIILTK
ncbi:MAG: hypothetical protein Q7U47_11225 [Paludibacter sp.]|nr:hypothetical protein [Paludibacter sp.]